VEKEQIPKMRMNSREKRGKKESKRGEERNDPLCAAWGQEEGGEAGVRRRTWNAGDPISVVGSKLVSEVEGANPAWECQPACSPTARRLRKATMRE